MTSELEELSLTEWHGIAGWLEEKLNKLLGHEFDFQLWDHSMEENRLSNGKWSVPATQIAVDECGFFIYCPISALNPDFQSFTPEFQSYLKTLKIDWTVFCFEQRWNGADWECALNPTIVVTRREIASDKSRF